MALILLPLSLDAYERIKSVKIRAGLSSLSDSDFFSQIFETELPKITTTPETVLEIKSEMEDSYFDHFSAPINQSLQCTSCKYKTSNDQELLSHFQSHHKYPGNYHCCCGLNFDDLTAFIQHSVLCATNKSNTTNLTKPDLKRKIISEPDLNYEPRNMRQRIAKLECKNCPRKFHTEYTLYLHDCQNNGVNKTSQNKLGNGNTSCLIKNQAHNHQQIQDQPNNNVNVHLDHEIENRGLVQTHKQTIIQSKEQQNVQILNHVEVEEKIMISMEKRSPVLIKEREPIKQFSPVNKKERSPPLMKECSPLLLKERSPVLIREHIPVLIREHSPALIKEFSPVLIKECSPILIKEYITVNKKPRSLVGVQEHGPTRIPCHTNEQIKECSSIKVEDNKILLSANKLIQPEPLLIDKHSDIKVRESNEIGVERHDAIILFKNNQVEDVKVCSNDTIKTQPGRLTCNCSEVFIDLTLFLLHQSTCGKPIVSTTPYISNNEKQIPLKVPVNSKGTYDCKECSKTFKSILSLRQHWDGMHRATPKHICKKCGRDYRWCTSLNYHSRKCKVVKPSNV